MSSARKVLETPATLSFNYETLLHGVKASVIRDIERSGLARRSDIQAIIPSRTLERRLSTDGNLKLDEADALARLVRVVMHARDTFEKDDVADEWLHSQNPALGNRIPIEMARTDMGAREVDAVLTRIEYGVYS
jgi:putative toxin-antitoxin system antitoxin component (TIGR02293 family)